MTKKPTVRAGIVGSGFAAGERLDGAHVAGVVTRRMPRLSRRRTPAPRARLVVDAVHARTPCFSDLGAWFSAPPDTPSGARAGFFGRYRQFDPLRREE